MSFIKKLGSIASGIGGFLRSNSLGSQLAKTALYGLALNKVMKSIQKSQDTDAIKDQGTTVSLNPDPKNAIPVVYGSAYTSGILSDAHMSSNNRTMWFCLSLSEMTGTKIDGTPSVFAFNEVYYNGLRLDFRSDGYTVDLAYDDAGNSTDTYSGLIEIYPFVDGSTNPQGFSTESAANSQLAYNLFPNWSGTDTMSGLVFALVKISYSPKNKINSVGDFKFKITNSMSLPGDVLKDYMTNTRYGAGIPSTEVNI